MNFIPEPAFDSNNDNYFFCLMTNLFHTASLQYPLAPFPFGTLALQFVFAEFEGPFHNDLRNPVFLVLQLHALLTHQ